MTTLEELKAKRDEINKEIDKMSAKRDKELTAEAQVFAGTCYLYKNSYGGGDNFLSYFKVVEVISAWAVGDSVNVQVRGIQVDDHRENYSIRAENEYLSMWQDNPISNAQFMKAYNKVLKKLTP